MGLKQALARMLNPERVKAGIYDFLEATRLLQKLQPWLSGLGVIVMFHRVVLPGDQFFDPVLAVTTEELDRFLGYVSSHGWDTLTISETVDRLVETSGRGAVRPFVCCTFDDGYRDNLTRALPIFRKYQAAMTVYVTTGYVERTTQGWWNVIETMLLERDIIYVSENGSTERVEVRNWHDKLAAYRRLSERTYREAAAGLTPLDKTFTLNGIDPQEVSDRFFMTWPELRTMANEERVEISAHTVTHRPLGALSAQEAIEELSQSRLVLQDRLTKPVNHMAYPFGQPGQVLSRDLELAREAGFRSGATTCRAPLFPIYGSNLMRLPRIAFANGEYENRQLRIGLYNEEDTLSFWRRNRVLPW